MINLSLHLPILSEILAVHSSRNQLIFDNEFLSATNVAGEKVVLISYIRSKCKLALGLTLFRTKCSRVTWSRKTEVVMKIVNALGCRIKDTIIFFKRTKFE